MTVRPALEVDVPALLEIHNDAVRTLDAIWTEREDTLEERSAWLRERTGQGYPVLVAEFDGEVLGYATYGGFRPKPGYRLTVEHSIYCSPMAQGRGIGTALMEALVADAREKGYHLMVGVVEARNAGSIQFHERFGFERTGTIQEAGFKHGHWLDEVYMVLRLNDDAAPPREA